MDAASQLKAVMLPWHSTCAWRLTQLAAAAGGGGSQAARTVLLAGRRVGWPAGHGLALTELAMADGAAWACCVMHRVTCTVNGGT